MCKRVIVIAINTDRDGTQKPQNRPLEEPHHAYSLNCTIKIRRKSVEKHPPTKPHTAARRSLRLSSLPATESNMLSLDIAYPLTHCLPLQHTLQYVIAVVEEVVVLLRNAAHVIR